MTNAITIEGWKDIIATLAKRFNNLEGPYPIECSVDKGDQVTLRVRTNMATGIVTLRSKEDAGDKRLWIPATQVSSGKALLGKLPHIARGLQEYLALLEVLHRCNAEVATITVRV